VTQAADSLTARGYTIARRYDIEGYPDDMDLILSDDGYGADEYVEVDKELVLVL